MPFEDRQRVIETNRSIRLIKNELESLLEKGVITDSTFDSISSLLPTESPLSGGHTPRATAGGLPTPAATASPAQSSPTSSFANLGLNSGRNPAPPSYSQSTGTGGPPSLPARSPPPPAPGKPVLANARALYRYAASDARDVSFERDDRIAVQEYMNADWWMGRNLRTGAEGIFPKSYVTVEGPPPEGSGSYPAMSGAVVGESGGYGEGMNEKQDGVYRQPQPTYGGYPPPPGPSQNPYNANVPPMAVAEQGAGGGGRMGEQGKKFGKKLGNAAIFGAGATIGSNLVNSIF